MYTRLYALKIGEKMAVLTQNTFICTAKIGLQARKSPIFRRSLAIFLKLAENSDKNNIGPRFVGRRSPRC
jgi:hypothetical protein